MDCLRLIMKLKFLLLVPCLLVACEGLEERSAAVGALCTSTPECGSDLLYCSKEGVCLCDTQDANYVFEYRHHFTIREPKCEILPCTLAKEQDKNECNLRHARCLPHPDGDEVMGYCKCVNDQVGARRGSAFTLSYCKDVTHSSVGEMCISNHYICDVSKKLKCRDGSCECYEGHLFSFEENMCIREEDYISRYGYAQLGTFGQYCSRSLDCNGGMACKNKRCGCPHFCRSGEYVRTGDYCYCAFDMTRLAYIIPSIVIAFLFLLFFAGLCYYNRKYNESLRAQSNLVLVHGRTTLPQTNSPTFIYNDNYDIRRSPKRSPGLPPQPSRPYSLLSAQANSLTRPIHDDGVDGVWDNTDLVSQSDSPDQTVIPSVDVQELNVGNFNSFYPPPPYQLNELVAAEVVEAQMRQPSPVPSQYRD